MTHEKHVSSGALDAATVNKKKGNRYMSSTALSVMLLEEMQRRAVYSPDDAQAYVPALIKALRYLLESTHGTALLAGSVGHGDDSDTKLWAIADVTSAYPSKIAAILNPPSDKGDQP
jgi:hypothetical protein